jgi:putative SOS response-associated peptidase YedK
MCNLYNMTVKRWELANYYQANDEFRRDTEMEKDYVAPGRDGWVFHNREGQRVVDYMKWGLPNPRGGKAVVNVRNYESPFW